MAASKNRPHWKIRDPRGRPPGSKAVFLCERYELRKDPGWRACTATAKGTGKRCRLHAMQGSNRCHKHAGHLQAYKARGIDWSKATIRSVPRYEMAKIGCGDPPTDMPRVPLPLSPVDRGRLYEAWRNHELAPKVWKQEYERAIERAPVEEARRLDAAIKRGR